MKFLVLVLCLIFTLAISKADQDSPTVEINAACADRGNYSPESIKMKHHALIFTPSGGTASLFVGNGALLSANTVLTSKSCIDGYKAGDLTVGLGLTNGGDSDASLHTVERIILYENSRYTEVDLAILKLNPDADTPSENITAVDLYIRGGYKVMQLSGFGVKPKTSLGANHELMQVRTRFMSLAKCRRTNAAGGARLTARNRCTENGLSSSNCPVDVGSPLVTMVGNIPKLIGITSKVDSGCNAVHTFITRGQPYYSWINSNSGK